MVGGELGPIAGLAEVDDPVVRDAGVGVFEMLDGVVGALRAGRDDLHCEDDLGCAQHAALPLAPLEPRPGHHGEIRAADRAWLGRVDKLQVDVDVGKQVESAGQLSFQPATEPEQASLMAGNRTCGHHQVAVLQLVARALGVLTQRDVVGDRQRKPLWRQGKRGHGRECGTQHRQFVAVQAARASSSSATISRAAALPARFAPIVEALGP